MPLEPGRVHGLIGPNGSGKSTLVRLLARQARPRRGSLAFCGRPIDAYRDREFARQLAYLPQTPPPTDGMTARELVALGRYPHHGPLGRLGKNDAAAMDEAMAEPRARDGLRLLPPTADGAADVEIYLEIRRPIRELVVVGAGHIAQPMAHIGALLGYKVTVLDDRPDFATRERFPDAHRLVRADFSDPFADVPIHERSHLLLVTRGHKYDYECLIRALRMDPAPAYIGMIGSRRRVRATYVQLIDEGISDDLIQRIHAPVGLDIAKRVEEAIAGKFRHGEAVALGVLVATALSHQLKRIPAVSVQRIEKLIRRMGFSLQVKPGIQKGEILKRMIHDKKWIHKARCWVLVTGIGKTVVLEGIPEVQVKKAVSSVMGG